MWEERSAQTGELGTSCTRKNCRLVVMGGGVSVLPGTGSPRSPSLCGSLGQSLGVHGCSSGLFLHEQSLNAGENTGRGR